MIIIVFAFVRLLSLILYCDYHDNYDGHCLCFHWFKSQTKGDQLADLGGETEVPDDQAHQ